MLYLITSNFQSRSIIFVHARAYFCTPLASVGITTYHTIGMHYNSKFTMKFDVDKMSLGSQYHFQDKPEFFSGKSHSEFFIRHWTENRQLTHKKIPVRFQHVMSKLLFLRGPVNSTEFYGKVQIMLNQQQKYLAESSGNIVLSATAQNWNLIPHPDNSRIVSLYQPDKGFLAVKPGTKQLTITQQHRSYFLKTITTQETLRLQTLVGVDLKEFPKEMDDILDADLEIFQIFRRAGIITEEMQRLYKSIDVKTSCSSFEGSISS